MLAPVQYYASWPSGHAHRAAPDRYVLRCERNWVLESESCKEEHGLVVAELGDVLEKVLIDFGKLFQRIGAVRLYERLDILREEMVDGRSRVR